MSAISSIPSTHAVTAPTPQTSKAATPAPAASDGDTAAQENAESITTKTAEAQNGGFAPAQTHRVNKLA
jgi:hypothetical protein